MRPTTFWCTECGAETIWVLADQLAAILGVCPRTVYNWRERGQAHTRKPGGTGLRLWCLCGACGQRTPDNRAKRKIFCKGLQECATLVLAHLQEATQTPDAITKGPSRRARSTTVLGA